MPRLFEVKFITKDTRLGATLMALDGLIYGKPEITPIKGAKVSKGQVRATNSGGSIRQKLTDAIIKSGAAEITRQEIKDLLEGVGGNRSSVSSFIDIMLTSKLLKRKGKANYRVIHG